MTESGSNGYYPFHPQPLPDESFSSWLIRLIRGHIRDQPLYRFILLEFGRDVSVWSRDADRTVSPIVINKLAEKTGRTVSDFNSLFLQAYEGTLTEHINSNGNSKWVLPLGIYHRTRRKFGQQWCPSCLKTDPIPYYRKSWRMAFSTCCLKHGKLLADRCNECAAPCIPHRGKFLSCHNCEADLTKQRTKRAESIAMQVQYELASRADDGLTAFYNEETIHSILFFDIWHQLLGLTTFSKRSRALRRTIIANYGGTDPFRRQQPQARSIEYLTTTDRHSLFGLVGRMMPGWPFRFIGVCAESRVWSSCILKDMRPERFELYNIAKTYLVGPLTRSVLPRSSSNLP